MNVKENIVKISLGSAIILAVLFGIVNLLNKDNPTSSGKETIKVIENTGAVKTELKNEITTAEENANKALGSPEEVANRLKLPSIQHKKEVWFEEIKSLIESESLKSLLKDKEYKYIKKEIMVNWEKREWFDIPADFNIEGTYGSVLTNIFANQIFGTPLEEVSIESLSIRVKLNWEKIIGIYKKKEDLESTIDLSTIWTDNIYELLLNK